MLRLHRSIEISINFNLHLIGSKLKSNKLSRVRRPYVVGVDNVSSSLLEFTLMAFSFLENFLLRACVLREEKKPLGELTLPGGKIERLDRKSHLAPS